MNYFSIHTQQGEHLGFLIMLADNEEHAQPQHGRFAVKLQSEDVPQDKAAINVLAPLQSTEKSLVWQIEKEHVELFDEGVNIGSIRQEYLLLSGVTLVLNDLTGIM